MVNTKELDDIVDALLEHETLTKEDLDNIVNTEQKDAPVEQIEEKQEIEN